MRFNLRKSSALLVVLSVGFYCSCEKHHAGELPAEREPIQANQPNASPAASPSVSPTPVEFFPQSSPH
jgi:hypothetical protein